MFLGGNAVNLLITEVTEMQRDNYCVAGWCFDAKRMVRPLPNGDHWRALLLDKHAIAPGVTISVTPQDKQLNNAYPHKTEDAAVYKASIRLVSAAPVPWFSPNAPPAAATVHDAFEGRLRHTREWKGARSGVHVPAGAQSRSLWSVTISRQSLSFKADTFDGGPEKLKAVFSDKEAQYCLAVTCRALKQAWRAGGLAAVSGALPEQDMLHLRLGLARPYGHPPDKCYVMVNGIIG